MTLTNSYLEIDEEKLEEGKPLMVRIENDEICVLKFDGKCYAFSNICTHIGGRLSEGHVLPGGRIACPMHKAVFDIKDGRSLSFPRRDLRSYPVKVEKGRLLIGSPSKVSWRQPLPNLRQNWWKS